MLYRIVLKIYIYLSFIFIYILIKFLYLAYLIEFSSLFICKSGIFKILFTYTLDDKIINFSVIDSL